MAEICLDGIQAINYMNDNYTNHIKIWEIESLRGIAAFFVVLLHLPIWNIVLDINFLRNSYLMVDLFFVLSGFVIYGAYSENIKSASDIFRFQLLRLGRLYPIHVLMLIVYLVLEFVRYITVEKFGTIVDVKPFEKSNLSSFIQHIFLVQSIGPLGLTDSYNVPAWSISVEFYTYLIFSVLILFFGKLKNIMFFIIFFLSITLTLFEKKFGFDALLRCFCGFFIGCIVAHACRITRVNFSSSTLAVCFAGLIIFMSFDISARQGIFIYFLTALLVFSLIKTEKSTIKQVLNSKPLIFLGAISYSLYMSHYVVIRIFDIILRRIFKMPVYAGINGGIETQLDVIQLMIALFFLIPIIIGVSYILYKYIELPLRALSRKTIFEYMPK